MHGSGGRRPLSGRRCSQGAEPLRGRGQEDRAASGWRSSDCGAFWVPGRSLLCQPRSQQKEGSCLRGNWRPLLATPGKGLRLRAEAATARRAVKLCPPGPLDLVQSGARPGLF